MATAHGRRPIDTLQLLAPDLDEKARQAEAERIVAGESTDFDGMRVLPGARELTESLAEARWTVATSGPRAVAVARLGFAGIVVPSTIVTAEDVLHGKPSPEPYLLAAHRLAIDPGDCLVIEDSPAGVRAARAAGAHVIAVRTTHSTEELCDAGADRLIPDLTAIRAVVDGNRVSICF